MSAQLVDYLAGRGRIALLGFGREGRSSYAFFRRHFPRRHIVIANQSHIDLDDSDATLLCGERYLDVLRQCDFLIKSPGVSLKDIPIPPALEITCQADLFLRFAPCKKIGITGSKGKTTTSTLIYEMLRRSRIPAQLMGNMGIPVLECMEDHAGEMAVMELSSHQLQYCRASPQVAVWTNLYEEHLDHYAGGFEEYATAKANICRWQTSRDLFIFNKDQPLFELAKLRDIQAELLPIGLDTALDDVILRALHANPRLRGRHNRQNLCFAAAAARRMGATREGIRQAVEEFRGIPHRMERISEAGGIHWVDDCITTIPHGVLCTIDALEDVDSLIFGGLDRGLDYQPFAEELMWHGIRNLICMPETGHKIAALLNKMSSQQNILEVQSMEEAVTAAFTHTAAGKTCLLSPAAASYNAYKDFEEKGAHFARAIEISSTAAGKPPYPE